MQWRAAVGDRPVARHDRCATGAEPVRTTHLDPVMSGVINELILQTQETRHVTSVVVTHDMTTVRKVADHVIMLYPLAKLSPDEQQIVFEGSRDELFAADDPRVADFVRGDASSRMLE